MKLPLVLLFVAASISASAQTSPSPQLASACGPMNINFKPQSKIPSTAPTTTPPPDPRKATVVFIQDDGYGGPHQADTIRVGINGHWVGAYKQNAYFSLSVDPGEQYVCANVQNRFPFGRPIELLHFYAEAGKIYYFRTRYLAGLRTLYPTYPFLELTPLDSYEAAFLMHSYPLTTMRPAH
ncbi:MAG: hypothetical protein HIU91_15835 [Acidobacteria bacterium]|nr:hypothetical protein [Acidobacteriota bacterium]